MDLWEVGACGVGDEMAGKGNRDCKKLCSKGRHFLGGVARVHRGKSVAMVKFI